MKLRLFNVLLLLLFTNTLFAGSFGLFHYDSHKLDLTFVSINRLEKIIDTNHWDARDLQKNILLTRMQYEIPLNTNDKNKKLWGIASFIWGCVLPFPVAVGIIFIDQFFQITPESLGLDVLWVYFGALVAGGILSVLIVYNSTKSKKEAINALLGCLTSVVALPLTIIIIAYITS